jgi:hypothetical protein
MATLIIAAGERCEVTEEHSENDNLQGKTVKLSKNKNS